MSTMSKEPTQKLNPIQKHERITTIDVLRGFALLGILLVNMAFFNTSVVEQNLRFMNPVTNWIDQIATWFILFFATTKFYTIFSFLFGLGFAIQLQRAQVHGKPFLSTYARRLLVLFLIGAAHAVLLWYGDILTTYALLGLVLLLFRNCRPRTLLIWSTLLLTIPIIAMSVIVGLFIALSPLFDSAGIMQQQIILLQQMAAEAERVYSSGSFAEIIGQHIQNLIFVASLLPATIFISFPTIMAMFLIGLYAGKRRIFQDIQAHLPFFRKVLMWGATIGVPLNTIYVVFYSELTSFDLNIGAIVATAAIAFGAPALAFAYMAGLTLLGQRESWKRWLSPLAPVGRMALTNYLLQTIICTTIFYSYGLGLYGQVGPAVGILLSITIFILQIPLSMWWLRHFEYGPMEWVWRKLTYGHTSRDPRPEIAPTS